MKIFNFTLVNGKTSSIRLLFIMSNILMINHIAKAQNSSYNGNSIPIGGTFSVGFGFQSLASNAGANNTASGAYSLNSNTIGGSNVAIGTSALRLNTSGASNTALGHNALYYNNGGWNVATGYDALFSNTTGGANTANGSKSLHFNTTGFRNTANGFSSLHFNTTGSYNTANGDYSLFSNTSGNFNTGSGSDALRSNTTGLYNTAFGERSLSSTTTGSFNSAVGQGALTHNLVGSSNTALGTAAGFFSVGSGNVFIGYKAGFNETRSDQLYVGNGETNTILYGNFASRQILLGNPNPVNYVFKGTRTLNVLGGILADSIRIALSADWSDYVFADTYKLKTLKEVEAFIKANKHLPGIPSEIEVKANGINVAEMNAMLLEKVEELTLYVINQQKQIDELKKLVKSKY